MPLVMPAAGVPSAQVPSHAHDELLGRLMRLYRALCVRHDEVGQEMVLNDILALLTRHHQHDMAESVIATCEISMPHRSNNQAARYFYYVGLTRALRLEYVDANQCLQQALRKAPERAFGFRVAATKLALVVQLLLGEIPPRSDFLQKDMRDSLSPYLQLASCVRFGQLGRFMSILQQHQSVFEHDRTYSLILRVRQHVIKTGLRRICQAYSRISIPDVCVKLSMENPADAEYIIAKAIRDGVIDAVIDHEKRHLISSDTVDVYSTSEPLLALQRRIQFLNVTHNEAKRSMRYTAADPDLEEERRKVDREEMDNALRAAMEDEDMNIADFEDGLP
ncbi:putative proteasome regulatory non-ATPase subunit 3 [Trypanosoma grayi]|uniref:putative proteasome regulatory non-ATPase subunit 3 n=1 Tax=Trypanosoma grayi TaxID=71804 RepID=UPI0004F3F8CB|nr:putative proteasome regulatory non-ATPase subunit 3 [Trypanosoma grayi]KEG09375.1 putative proteasome regulatory non-ATPase subunit 3 [Trypanosoma grayi]